MAEAKKDNQLDVCTVANYNAGSLDMQEPIKQIMDNRCCVATVLYGQVQDVSMLLLEAHRRNYAGEWIIAESVNYVDGIFVNLRKHLDESTIHRLLRGMFEWKLNRPVLPIHLASMLILMPYCALFHYGNRYCWIREE